MTNAVISLLDISMTLMAGCVIHLMDIGQSFGTEILIGTFAPLGIIQIIIIVMIGATTIGTIGHAMIIVMIGATTIGTIGHAMIIMMIGAGMIEMTGETNIMAMIGHEMVETEMTVAKI